MLQFRVLTIIGLPVEQPNQDLRFIVYVKI